MISSDQRSPEAGGHIREPSLAPRYSVLCKLQVTCMAIHLAACPGVPTYLSLIANCQRESPRATCVINPPGEQPHRINQNCDNGTMLINEPLAHIQGEFPLLIPSCHSLFSLVARLSTLLQEAPPMHHQCLSCCLLVIPHLGLCLSDNLELL